MGLDLLIRNAMVVDGSGMPGFRADVGISGNRIVAVGRLSETAARTIDADGLVVAPGFIDHHTHLDAQILWDPYGTSAPEHGVTTVVIGNCGLSLAPVRPGGEDDIVKNFVRVEAMPRVALEAGVPWGWRTYGEYLDRLEGKLGVNLGGLVGHVAIRQTVLGEDAVERAASADEVEQMRRLVREALESGALGISTNRNSRHLREDGKPVASRLADDQELFALCDVLAELNAGVIQTSGGTNRQEALARRTQRPVIWQSIQHRWTAPDLWREQLEDTERVFRAGYRAYGTSNTVQATQRFTLKNAQAFDEMPSWKAIMFLPESQRRQALAEPATRQKLRADLADPQPITFHRRWDLIRVDATARAENAHFVGKTVAEVAAMRGQDPLDAFLDLSLEEDLETTFWTTVIGGDPEVTGRILTSPYVVLGISDAGAHVEFDARFGYTTILLGDWVREQGVISLEQAVHKLSFQVALILGLPGRGLVQPGYAADLTIFDPQTVRACDPEPVTDYPAGVRRMIQRSQGLYYTIVNGRVIFDNGRLTGELPGQVLRGSAYRPSAAGAQ